MSKNIDLLIVGLGNHDEVYKETRHNIGWAVASMFVQKHHSQFIPLSPNYFLANVVFVAKNILVALPRTYMNNSGVAVRELVEKYKIPTENLLVICDEINFPIGKIHLKDSGGDGGHNGVASVIEFLETQNFMRLRCGIGPKVGTKNLADYVLSPFEPEEIPLRDFMIKRAVESVEYLILKGKSRAMSDINSENLWKIKIEKEQGKD
ncbi:MAG: aminoacyl-tRNA hydrolase [Ignavibacteria bacterium]|nr:aminoacyl-tRNA hydrolase [Ignavibacteria bacterium]